MGTVRTAIGVGLVLSLALSATALGASGNARVAALKAAKFMASKAQQGGQKALRELAGPPPPEPRVTFLQRLKHIVHGDPRQLDKASLDTLAAKKIGSYFPENVGEAGVAQLDKDVQLYVYNLGKLVTGRPGALSDEAGLLREWGEVKAALSRSIREGVKLTDETRGRTVEQYVLELHRRVKNPQKVDPLDVRLQRGAANVAWAPVRMTGRFLRTTRAFVAGALVMSFGLGLFSPVVNAPLNRVTAPIVTTIDSYSYYYLGDVQIAVQKVMSRFTAYLEMKQSKVSAAERVQTAEGMQKVLKDFTRIADKYAIGQLSQEQARQLWMEAETPLYLLGKNANAIANPIFKEGRNVQRDLIQAQLWFATYGETVYNGMRDRQRDLAALEEKWEGRQMSPGASAERQLLTTEIGAAQERLGMNLAQWRINQMLFPEYTKMITIGDAEQSKLLHTYEVMLGSMRLDLYFRAAIDHYKKQLDILGIPPGAQQMEYVAPHGSPP